MKRRTPAPSAAQIRAGLAFQTPTCRRTTQDAVTPPAPNQLDNPGTEPNTRACDTRKAKQMKTYSKCGARTRRGTRCLCRPLKPGGRCRLHGGASSGPVTERGRRQSAENLKAARAALAGSAHTATRHERSLRSAETKRRRERARRQRELDLKLGIRLPASLYGLSDGEG